MRLTLPLFITCCLAFSARSQLLVAPDTLRAHERVLGTADSLMQFMAGFSSPFFIGTGQASPDLWTIFKPGISPRFLPIWASPPSFIFTPPQRVVCQYRRLAEVSNLCPI